MKNSNPHISILGGTGDLGSGLAWHLASAVYSIEIGSRQVAKAQSTAQELRISLPNSTISGTGNVRAAKSAEIVILTVPYTSKQPILESIWMDGHDE